VAPDADVDREAEVLAGFFAVLPAAAARGREDGEPVLDDAFFPDEIGRRVLKFQR